MRLAYVVSHPIQYQVPLLRRIAAEPDIDLTVFYCSDFSLRAYQDKGFGTSVQWDVPLLEGYRSVILPRIRETHEPSSTRPVSFGFLRYFLHGRFDAVWVHGYATVNSLHAIVAAKLLGLPVLLRTDGWLGDRPRTGRTLLTKKLFFRALAALTDGPLAVGTLNREYWECYFGKRVPGFLLPYAVDNDFFASAAQEASRHRSALHTALQLEPDRPVILFASKLQTRKHCDHLLEAYLRLRPASGADPEAYLVIVGEGEQRTALEQRARESGCGSIRFAGFRNQTELPGFFDLCSVFVLPARHEPWGLIVNEVMNAARPVIVTDDVGAAPDLVLPGKTGWVYPTGNADALYAALVDALSDPVRTAQMGEQAREHISRWNFEADIAGLRHAIAYTTRKIRA